MQAPRKLWKKFCSSSASLRRALLKGKSRASISLEEIHLREFSETYSYYVKSNFKENYIEKNGWIGWDYLNKCAANSAELERAVLMIGKGLGKNSHQKDAYEACKLFQAYLHNGNNGEALKARFKELESRWGIPFNKNNISDWIVKVAKKEETGEVKEVPVKKLTLSRSALSSPTASSSSYGGIFHSSDSLYMTPSSYDQLTKTPKP